MRISAMCPTKESQRISTSETVNDGFSTKDRHAKGGVSEK